MRTNILIAATLGFVFPAWALQIGPEIRIGGGEATIGGVGVKGGKVAVPNAGQVLDTIINSTPLAVLSDADKNVVKQAIVVTGVVSTIARDPITGLVILSVIQGENGERKDIPVPVNPAIPSTGKSWTFVAKCIVQQEQSLITALFVDDPVNIMTIADGDALIITAPHCPEYQQKSVTSVTMILTGRSDVPNASPGKYRHYLVGRSQ